MASIGIKAGGLAGGGLVGTSEAGCLDCLTHMGMECPRYECPQTRSEDRGPCRRASSGGRAVAKLASVIIPPASN